MTMSPIDDVSVAQRMALIEKMGGAKGVSDYLLGKTRIVHDESYDEFMRRAKRLLVRVYEMDIDGATMSEAAALACIPAEYAAEGQNCLQDACTLGFLEVKPGEGDTGRIVKPGRHLRSHVEETMRIEAHRPDLAFRSR